MKIPKEVRSLVNRINNVIARRNLYMQSSGCNVRVYNCEVIQEKVCVHSLHDDTIIPVEGRQFQDGYGQLVDTSI